MEGREEASPQASGVGPCLGGGTDVKVEPVGTPWQACRVQHPDKVKASH